MKNLFCLVIFCLCFTLFSAEYKYVKPVKALISVIEKDNCYYISGCFAREKRFSKAFNKQHERKYVMLFAENALMRFLNKKDIKSISFQAAQIKSNISTAKDDENISFTYVIPVQNCKFEYVAKPVVASETAPTPAPAGKDSVHTAEKNKSETSIDNNDKQNIVFEIASPEEIFNDSWKAPSAIEQNHKDNVDKIISDFNKVNI